MYTQFHPPFLRSFLTENHPHKNKLIFDRSYLMFTKHLACFHEFTSEFYTWELRDEAVNNKSVDCWLLFCWWWKWPGLRLCFAYVVLILIHLFCNKHILTSSFYLLSPLSANPKLLSHVCCWKCWAGFCWRVQKKNFPFSLFVSLSTIILLNHISTPGCAFLLYGCEFSRTRKNTIGNL